MQRSCIEISCFGIVCRDKERQATWSAPSHLLSLGKVSPMEHICSYTSKVAPGFSGQQLKMPVGIRRVQLSPDLVEVRTAFQSLVQRGLSDIVVQFSACVCTVEARPEPSLRRLRFCQC